MSKVPDIKIAFCMVTFNRFEETMINIRRTSPHVDRTIIIDGGSSDGSIEWLRSEECKNLRVECYVHKWMDNPPEQRTKYLELIDEGWVLTLDCDELLELPALYKIKYIVQEAIDHNCDGVAFRAHDIQIDTEGGIYDSLSSYYNRILFKSCPRMMYVGHTHVALVRPGLRDACMKTEYQYYHIKTWADGFFRACRNYWTTAGVAENTTNDPSWKELKVMTLRGGFQYFHQFAEYVKKGNIDLVYKRWFVDHRDDNNPEARSWFVSYFGFLHPEENIDKIGNKDIPYQENRKSVKLMA